MGLYFDTPRLIIRPVTAGDADATAKLMSESVARWLISWSAPLTVEDARHRISWSRRRLLERRAADLAFLIKSTSELAGWVGLHLRSDDAKSADLGFWIGSDFKEAGYTSEAVAACIPQTMRWLGANVLFAGAWPENARSIKILKKLGMAQINDKQLFDPKSGRYRTCLNFRYDAREGT